MAGLVVTLLILYIVIQVMWDYNMFQRLWKWMKL